MKIQQSRGMVLLVSLVMVALMSLIAVAAIRGSNLQEAMAGNLRDRNMAFQAAEAGLRIGEKNVDGSNTYGAISTNSGYYTDLLSSGNSSPTQWTDAQWNTRSVTLADDTIAKVAKQPQVVHESIDVTGTAQSEGSAIDFESRDRTSQYQFFRVTSRAVGLTSNSQVILQSTFVH